MCTRCCPDTWGHQLANALLTFRQDVEARLEAVGIHTVPYFPAVLSAPGAVLAHGNPYLEQGDTMCEVRANLDLLVFVLSGDNESATNELDEMVIDALGALWSDYGPLEVEEPFIITNNEANYMAVRISVSEYFNLGA